LVERCSNLTAPATYLDVDDPDFLLPGNLPGKIRAQLKRRQIENLSPNDDNVFETTSLILHSLARRYADVVRDITAITGREIKKLYIVGGGSRNAVLNRLTAEHTGLQVIPGSAESSTIGNFAVQLARLDGDRDVPIGVRPAAVSAWAQALTACAFIEAKEVPAEVIV